MPQSGQIIPFYLHPHTMTVINDNTVYRDEVAEQPDGIRAPFVYASSRGIDNEIVVFTDEQQMLMEHGIPNFKMFGQPQYNAYNWLRSRKGKAYAMRVTPADAAHANVIIVAKVKVVPAVVAVDGSITTPGSMTVRYEVLNQTGVNDKEEMEALTEAVASTDPDADGYISIPVLSAYVRGRGIYGDNFRIRISSSRQADKENFYKNYMFEIFEMGRSLERLGFFVGSVDPEAVLGANSHYLVDKVNDPDTGSKHVRLYISEDGLIDLYEAYKKANPATDLLIGEVDFLTGKTKAGTALEGYTVNTTHVDAFALDAPEGFPLTGGDDGSLSVATPAGERETVLNSLYGKAFRGEITKVIRSRSRAPMDVILDAGYSDEVKRDLVAMTIRRDDAYAYLDGGVLPTIEDAYAWGEEFSSLSSRLFGKHAQSWKVRDPFNGRPIRVTASYFMADTIPNHFASVGRHVPITGADYAQVTGMIRGSMMPVVDIDDLDVKERLYELNINYFEQISESVVVRGTQETSQSVTSDLSEENNMLTLLQIKRELEIFSASTTYDFADAGERANFTQVANERLEKYINVGVKSASVRFDMNPWETQRMILHCYADVVFRTMSKRQIIEIDINPRS